MESEVLTALQRKVAYVPGTRSRDGQLLFVSPVPNELQPWTRNDLAKAIKYLVSMLSSETKGLAVVVDATKSSWRMARMHIRHLQQMISGDLLVKLIVVKADSFLRDNSCSKPSKSDEPITIVSRSRLFKYFSSDQLPVELGGTLTYSHEQWLKDRMNFEQFHASYESALADLDNLHVQLLESKSMRASETQPALKHCAQLRVTVQQAVKDISTSGNRLMADMINAQSAATSDAIKTMLNELEQQDSAVADAWLDMEQCVADTKEMAALEDGVGVVTNWILSTAEHMLNEHQKIGHDVQSCEELRREHETIEMQCLETYGFYAELLHKIDVYPFVKDTYAYRDLMSQKDFMDFVCRSFATRLERRRNILITSLRFFRLVAEYFDRTSEVFESLVMGANKAGVDGVHQLQTAAENLQKLRECQQNLEVIEKELVKEGEMLSDMLAMPVKDALGRDVGIDFSEDIATIHDILDATNARRNIFMDNVEVQKLTLEQTAHVQAYEADSTVALKWMDDLFNVLMHRHTHVGCNVYEIQAQKEELQTFQDTARSTYNYGCQLIEAALALRQSCKLAVDDNIQLSTRLQLIWQRMDAIGKEQITRLRVSAVFHRSVDEHCRKLIELRRRVVAIGEADYVDGNDDERSQRLRKYLACRERLLVEVGRMVRLGRLLKTRLKDPLLADDGKLLEDDIAKKWNNFSANDGNFDACNAIAMKLNEVARIAENLDRALKDTHKELTDAVEIVSSSSDRKCASDHEEWNSSVKSLTEDESFMTASDCACTPHSRSSSSYHTAEEYDGSPPSFLSSWNLVERKIVREDSNLTVDTNENSSSGVANLSSGNASFDDDDQFSAMMPPALSSSSSEGRTSDSGYLAMSMQSPSRDSVSSSWADYYKTLIVSNKQTLKGCF